MTRLIVLWINGNMPVQTNIVFMIEQGGKET